MGGSTSKALDIVLMVASIIAVLCVGASAGMELERRKAQNAPFVAQQLTCLDASGKPAVNDSTLSYVRDGGTVVGTDKDGSTFIYTPPAGWVCRIGKVAEGTK